MAISVAFGCIPEERAMRSVKITDKRRHPRVPIGYIPSHPRRSKIAQARLDTLCLKQSMAKSELLHLCADIGGPPTPTSPAAAQLAAQRAVNTAKGAVESDVNAISSFGRSISFLIPPVIVISKAKGMVI